MERIEHRACFGGWQDVYRHRSAVLGCDMTFAIYLPPQAQDGPVPVLYWLSGLTCSEQNFITKAGAGQEISTRPFQLVTGRKWLGTAFGGVKGRSQLPGMVEEAMAGEIQLAPFVTHTMGLDAINEAFDLMHEGKSIRSVVHF